MQQVLKDTASPTICDSSEAASWFSRELDRRYREVLYHCNIDYAALDIPYLNSAESTALLNAELRIHLTDSRLWKLATPLLYRHLMRSGLSPDVIGAILGRAGHTVRTGAGGFSNEFNTALRIATASLDGHGFTGASTADIQLARAHQEYLLTGGKNAQHQPSLTLNSRLYI